ncbi:MAG: signal peptidase I [Solirubrobacteraceae bacterium]|nr:signal peptidase I [Solirubrobacteraceae bacterium]
MADETPPGSPVAVGDATDPPTQGKRRRIHPLAELVLLVVIALGLALGIQAFLVKPYQIPSGSMIPTLEIHQRVLVNRISHHLGSDPSVGDVVVFHPPRGARPGDSGYVGEQQCAEADNIEKGAPCVGSVGGEWEDENYIKRVVGGPGDRIAVKDGRVIRNGEPTDEPFISDSCRGQGAGSTCDLPNEITVPEGHYYMMGDNRGDSEDSRVWGAVPRDWVVGGAFATYWPPKRIGGL